MRTSLTVGRIAGIPLKIHVNWFLIAALVTWSLAAGYFPQEYPGWKTSVYWAIGLVTSMLFFGSVLLHELGHSIIALREGVPVKSITLFIFGGVAHIGNEPETPGSEFRIVAAGPLVSVLLAVLFKLVGWIEILGPQVTGMADYLCQVNIILAVFNMIPGFPLDGGRILRAVIWKLAADFRRATRWAANAGMGIALLFILAGLFLMLLDNFLSGVWVAFIGWYLSTTAQEGFRQAAAEDIPGDLAGSMEKTRPKPVAASAIFTIHKGRLKTLSLATVVEGKEKLVIKPLDRMCLPGGED